MKYKEIAIACVLIGTAFMACHKPEHPGYEKTASGIFYKTYLKGKDTTHAKPGDRVTLQIVCKSEKDCVLIDTRKGNGHLPLLMRKSVYPGDIFEAVCTMHPGDSTGFIIGAKDYFEKLERIKPPAFIDSTSLLYFSIKMDKLEAKDIVEAEQQKRMDQQRREMESAKTDEPVLMKKYLEDNKIKAKPTPSGLIYVETQKGKGENIKSGQLVSAKYTGKFLDGQIFDSSERSGKPFEFRVGKQEVIPGWDEGFQLMKKGGKATFIIPSSLAYADGGGRMKPYATLVFDVEVLDVKNAPAVPEAPHGPSGH